VQVTGRTLKTDADDGRCRGRLAADSNALRLLHSVPPRFVTKHADGARADEVEDVVAESKYLPFCVYVTDNAQVSLSVSPPLLSLSPSLSAALVPLLSPAPCGH